LGRRGGFGLLKLFGLLEGIDLGLEVGLDIQKLLNLLRQESKWVCFWADIHWSRRWRRDG
jgi:hypothetical protein